MSSIYFDIDYGNQVTIPNTTLAVEVERRFYNTRATTKVRNRLYNNTYLSNVIYCPYGCTNVGSGTKTTGGGTATKVYSCSTCPSTCKNRGYTYVSCLDGGQNCRCETGAVTQKCNLSGAICKANDPRATSCSVRTYTNGSCVCDCKHGSVSATPPAPAGTVKSVSKPVTSTTLKPGVIPKAGAVGSPEAEGTGATSVPLSSNTKFGSYDIATLRAQPPQTYSGAVALAAANRQYDALVLLQSVEGKAYYDQLGHMQRLARNVYNEFKAGKISSAELDRRYKQDILPKAAKTLELGTKWKEAYYSASWARNPDLYGANPIKNATAKEVENKVEAIKKTTGTGSGLGLATAGKGLGPLGGGIEPAIGDIANGIMTGHLPDPLMVLGNFSKGVADAITQPQIPSPTVDIIKNMLNDADTYKMLGMSVEAGVA